MLDNRIISKIVLMGDYQVGKTSIRRSYMGESFVSDHISTLGSGFAVKKIPIDNKLTMELQIWDLAGQSGFEELLQRYILGTQAAFLVFDISNRSTFENLDYWLNQLLENIEDKQIPIFLIANKIDLDEKVSKDEIENYINNICKTHNLKEKYIHKVFTSAKTGENIEKAFKTLVNLFLNDLELK